MILQRYYRAVYSTIKFKLGGYRHVVFTNKRNTMGETTKEHQYRIVSFGIQNQQRADTVVKSFIVV